MSKQPLITDRTIPFIAAISVRLIAILLVASLFASSVAASELQWMNDLEKAKQVAAAQHKDLLINFTGLKWCGPCMRLESEVLASEAFAPAAEHFVLVRLDYPGGIDRLPEEPPPPTPAWRNAYGVGGYPTIFLADASGKPYAVTGNIGMKAPQYLQHVLKLRAAHEKRDTAFANAEKLQGVELAKALAVGLTALEAGFADKEGGSNADPLVQFYRAELENVIHIDADNAAGLRDRFREVLQRESDRLDRKSFFQQLTDTYAKQGIEETLRVLDQKTNEPISREYRNQLRAIRLNYLEGTERFSETIAYAETLAVDESFDARERRSFRRRIAQCIFRQGRTEEALAAFDRLIAEAKQQGSHVEYLAMTDKADIYLALERFQDSLDIYDAAIKLVEPNSFDWSRAQAWRVQLLARLGRVDDAWRVYGEFAASPSATQTSRYTVMVAMAYCLNKQGATAAARDAAKKAQTAFDQLNLPASDTKELKDNQQIVQQILAPPTDAKSNDSKAAQPQ